MLLICVHLKHLSQRLHLHVAYISILNIPYVKCLSEVFSDFKHFLFCFLTLEYVHIFLSWNTFIDSSSQTSLIQKFEIL